MPRIISGRAGGLRIKSPTGRGTRPTTDRVKESVCNILSPYFEQARVLDLFAGTGSLGLEAVSRGALSCTFVEKDRQCAALLKENIHFTKLEAESSLLIGDVFQIIPRLPASGEGYSLVLMDPPYRMNFVWKTLHMLDEHDIIVPDGIVAVEHDPDEPASDAVGRLLCVRRERYGDTAFSFYLCSGKDAV